MELTGLEFDLELAGFDTAELDIMLESGNSSGAFDPADTFALPQPDQHAVSRLGDLWQLGPHRLLCGNALQPELYEGVLNGAKAELVFTDPPYNVPIQGHVSGLGRTHHREFVEGSGELSSGEFQLFLHQALKLAAACSQDGAIHFVCMDWRGVSTLLLAGASVYRELKNICVWNKTNAGMGSLYRSQHELVLVYKHGTAPHRNNVELGKHGRHRTNVWTYPGANAFGPSRAADLAAHPTVKPISLVADAIRDCSKRGAIVLDPFAGSGTTILAAERTGRRGAAIELDPLYVDTAVRRWQALSGQPAVLASTGRAFSEVAEERCSFAQHRAKDGGPSL